MTYAIDDPDLAAVDVLRRNLDSPIWRLNNLYKIIVKSKDETGDDNGLVMRFRPNRAQRRLLANVHNRLIVLKARQLGYSTLVAILWLDTALFSKSPIFCGIIAHEREAGESIFRDKILFAYENLPPALKAAMPLRKRTETTLVFDHNGATIKVATSVRSATIHRLHVSEFGKIAAKYPAKAREVITGSLPAVPSDGIIVIESTAEGQDGPFYTMTQRALAQHQAGTALTSRDYRLVFSAWWDADDYVLDPTSVQFTEADLTYFNEVEAKISRTLTDEQRAWYVSTLRADFSGERPLMWQEFPGYPDEAFRVSTEGCYYATQLANARKHGQILPRLPRQLDVPVFTFWDLGRADMTAIWLMQAIGPERRFIGYYEESGEDLSHYATWLQKQGFVYARHYVPHDAGVKRLGEHKDTNRSLAEILEGLLPGQPVEIVPRVTNILSGIQATRNAFASAYFDEAACAQGLKRLAGYRKEWDKVRGRWKDDPLHDDNSHGADAFRQYGQVVDAGGTFQGAGHAALVRAGKAQAQRGGRSRFVGRRSPMAV